MSDTTFRWFMRLVAVWCFATVGFFTLVVIWGIKSLLEAML